MGAHHQVDGAAPQPGQDALLLRRRHQPRQHGQAQREGGQAALEVAEVLQGQDGGRAEEGHLAAVGHGAQGGAQRHLGLAEADVAADQAVHGEIGLHVGQHAGDGLLLVLGLHEAEVLLQPLLQLGDGAERGLAHRLAHGVQVEQLAGVVDDGLARALGLGLPGPAAQAVESRRRPLAAAVAPQHLQLVQRHVEELAVEILDLEELAAGAVQAQAGEAGEAADAVAAVHHPVALGHVAELLLAGGAARPLLGRGRAIGAAGEAGQAQARVLERAGDVEEMAFQRRQAAAQVLQQPGVGGEGQQPPALGGPAPQVFDVRLGQLGERPRQHAHLGLLQRVGGEVGQVGRLQPGDGEAEEPADVGERAAAAGHRLADAAEVLQQLAVLVLQPPPVGGQHAAAGKQVGQERRVPARGRRVAVLADAGALKRAGGALRLQVEGAQRGQALSFEFQAQRPLGGDREDVEHVAAPGQVAGDLHRLARLVAHGGQAGDEVAALPQVAAAQLQRAAGAGAGALQADGEGGQGRQHDHLPAPAQLLLQPLPVGDAPRVGLGVDVGVLPGEEMGMDQRLGAAEQLQPLAELLAPLIERLVLADDPDDAFAAAREDGGDGELARLAVDRGDLDPLPRRVDLFPEFVAENDRCHLLHYITIDIRNS